ncbi:MAG: mechanosensitive ion channel family protein [Bdellovibrionia bacterium]
MTNKPFFDHHSLKVFGALLGPRIGWVIVSLLFGFVARWIFARFSDRYLRKRSHLPGFSNQTSFFGWRTQFLFTLIALHLTLPWMEYDKLTSKSIDQWIGVGIIISVWLVLARVLRLFRWVANVRYDMSHPDNLLARKVRTQLYYLEEVAQITVGFIAFCMILMSFESARRYGSSLIASAGLAGVIIGFAAQRFLGSIIAGLQIAFTQPLRIDDVVIVEGEWGKVQEISLTYIVIGTWDGRSLVVPITYFVEKPFQNWTRTNAELLGSVLIFADYTLPVQQLRSRFEELIQGSPLWDGKVGKIHVTDATEKSMQIRALVSARNAGDAFELRCYVREELIRFIQNQSPSYLPKARVTAVEPDSAVKNGEAA